MPKISGQKPLTEARVFTFRLEGSMRLLMDAKAREAGLTVTEYMRRKLMEEGNKQTPLADVSRLKAEMGVKAVEQLSRMLSNLPNDRRTKLSIIRTGLEVAGHLGANQSVHFHDHRALPEPVAKMLLDKMQELQKKEKVYELPEVAASQDEDSQDDERIQVGCATFRVKDGAFSEEESAGCGHSPLASET